MRTETAVDINWKTFYYRLYVLAAPIAFQSLMLASVAAGDALMLGRVAQYEMTAVSLATQIQFVQNMFISAIAAAGAILGAQYYGKGDRRTIQELFNLMLRFSILLSLLFFAACELAPGMLMRIFAHPHRKRLSSDRRVVLPAHRDLPVLSDRHEGHGSRDADGLHQLGSCDIEYCSQCSLYLRISWSACHAVTRRCPCDHAGQDP